jgi:hypothetical protein
VCVQLLKGTRPDYGADMVNEWLTLAECSLWPRPPAAQEETVKTVLFVLALSVLLTLPSHGQQFPETDRQKAQ